NHSDRTTKTVTTALADRIIPTTKSTAHNTNNEINTHDTNNNLPTTKKLPTPTKFTTS
ncbi:693_t:CDS:1, partial [Gigaspora rosea]